MSLIKTEEGLDEAEIQEVTEEMAKLQMPQNVMCLTSYYCDSCYAMSLSKIGTDPPGTFYQVLWPKQMLSQQFVYVKDSTQGIQGTKTLDAGLSMSSPSPPNQAVLEATAAPAENPTQTMAAYYTNAQTNDTPANYMMLEEPALVQSGAAYRVQQMSQTTYPHPPPLIPIGHLNGGLRYDGPQYGQGMEVVDLGVATFSTNAPKTATQSANYITTPQQSNYQPPSRSPKRRLKRRGPRFQGPQQGQRMEAVAPGVPASSTNAPKTATESVNCIMTPQQGPKQGQKMEAVASGVAAPRRMVAPTTTLENTALVKSWGYHRLRRTTPVNPGSVPPLVPIRLLEHGVIRLRGPHHQMEAVDVGVAATHTNAQTMNTPENYMWDSMVEPSSAEQMTAQQTKYPPPLIPVGELKPDLIRFYFHEPHHQQAQEMGAADSGVSQDYPPTMANQEPVHQQFFSNQPSTSVNDHNGSMSMNSPQREPAPLPDPPRSDGSHISFQLKRSILEGKLIECINLEPDVFDDALVTLHDLASIFFNNMPVPFLQQIILALGIELFNGNNSQVRILWENGKCLTLNDVVPLVRLQSVRDHMHQLRYLMGGIFEPTETEETEQMAKRQRTS